MLPAMNELLSVFSPWRSIPCALLLLLAAAGCKASAPPATAAPQPAGRVARPAQSSEALNAALATPVQVRYQLFLPREYGVDPAHRWPMILFLHGAGERGDNLEAVKVHGPPKICERDADFPFVVVSPQCPSDQAWSNDALNALLDHVLATLAIDPKRVYLTGLSMGGFGA